MILEKVYELAKPRLKGRTIKDVRIGLGLMALALDNDLVGVTYVLNKETDQTCGAIPQAGNLVGMNAEDIGLWAIERKNVIRSAVGLGVLNAVADFNRLEHIHPEGDGDAVFSIDIKEDDTIGVIGHIGPIINRLRSRENPIYIFERDASKGSGDTYPERNQPELLPRCQIVFVTSSTLINGTLEPLLPYCSNARDIVMVGSSTPLYPQAFTGTGVTTLAGTRWCSSEREAILTSVSQCAGIKQLMKYGEKISVKVPASCVIKKEKNLGLGNKMVQ